MATGTGLPALAPPGGEVVATPPPVSNADALSSAHAWGQIAAAGEKIASAGLDTIQRDIHLQKAGTTADFENSNRDWYVKANDQYNGDPVGLENASRAHNDGALAEVPPWLVPHAKQFLGGSMERGVAQQLAVKRNADDNNARQSLEFRLKTTDDDAMSLASAGQLNSEQGRASLATYHGVLKTAVDTGVMVQEKADFLENNFIERAQGAILRKDTEDIYRQKGFQAAKDYVDKATADLGAQYKFSDKIRTQALGWLRSEEAGMRGERDSISREWGTAKPLLGTIAPETLQDMADRAYSVGAVKVGDDIRSHLAAVDVNNSLRQLPDSDRLKLLQTGKYTGDAPAMLRQFEGLKLGAYYDVNAFRTGYGSDTVTRADGTVEKVTAGTRITQEDAERDLQRRTAQTQDSIRSKIGDESWNKLSDAAKTSLTSVAYNYGSLPDRVIPAVQSGDPQAISQAIVGLSGDNGGINARRRSAEAANVLASGSNGVDLTQSRPGLLALGMMKKEMSANMGQKISDLHGAVLRSEFPPMDEVNALAGQVGLLGTPEQKTKFAEIAATAQYGDAFTKANPQQRTQLLSEMDARMNAGAPAFERHLTDTLHAADQRITEGYKKDPYGADVRYGVGSTPIAQLDFASKDLGADIADRVTRQNRIRADQGLPAFSIMRPAEAAQTSQALTQGDPKMAAGILGHLSVLPQDILHATLDDPSIKTAITGMARSGDPTRMNAAYSFMDTQQKQNPLEFEKQFPDGLKDLRAWQSNLAFYPPPEAAKRLMRAYDPSEHAANAASDEVAHTALKAVSADNVVSKFSTGWGPIGVGARAPVSDQAGIAKGALKADYDKNYRDGFAATGDATAADKFAMEKLHLKYSVSPTNGNRVMANAPENYYPKVGGSWDWMAKQLDDSLAGRFGIDKSGTSGDMGVSGTEMIGTEIPGEDAGAGAVGRRYAAPRALVSDTQTERDIANNKPPSYQVIFMDKDGRWSAMTGVDGAAARYRFDPTEPFAKRATKMESMRDALLHPLSETLP